MNARQMEQSHAPSLNKNTNAQDRAYTSGKYERTAWYVCVLKMALHGS